MKGRACPDRRGVKRRSAETSIYVGDQIEKGKAIAAGTAVITATTGSGLGASCAVTVP